MLREGVAVNSAAAEPSVPHAHAVCGCWEKETLFRSTQFICHDFLLFPSHLSVAGLWNSNEDSHTCWSLRYSGRNRRATVRNEIMASPTAFGIFLAMLLIAAGDVFSAAAPTANLHGCILQVLTGHRVTAVFRHPCRCSIMLFSTCCHPCLQVLEMMAAASS